ncbi:MAG: hypothetical protein HFH86_01030 [Bacilli bacterium]|nr:hypothetical protein [Bacilli bacterium]
MKIGIDIDDTLTETQKKFQQEIKKYCRRNKIIREKETQRLTEEQFQKFMQEQGRIYLELKLKKKARKVLQKWNQNGHQIYFVTARSEQDCPKVEEYTKDYLQYFNIPYQKIIFNAQNKGKDCKKLNLDVFIDDRESVLDSFNQSKTFLVRFINNKKNYSKYTKVCSWKELEKIMKFL